MFSPLAGPIFLLTFVLTSVAGRHNVTVQENDPRIVYSGGWDRITSFNSSVQRCTDGAMRTTTVGSSFEFSFNGTDIYLNTIADVQQGAYKVKLDDGPTISFDSVTADSEQCRIAFSRSGLVNGPHRLVVVNDATIPLLFDSLTYTTSDSPARPAMTYPGTRMEVPIRPLAPRMVREGTWTSVDVSGKPELNYCADVVGETSIIGASLEMRFNGTSVYVMTVTDPHSRSLVTITLDGESHVVDGRSSSPQCSGGFFQDNLNTTFEHVIRVTNTGPTVSTEPAILQVIGIKYVTTSEDPSVEDSSNQVDGVIPLPDYTPYENKPVSPVVIGGVVGAGVTCVILLGIAFMWARRDRRREQAYMADPERQMKRTQQTSFNSFNSSGSSIAFRTRTSMNSSDMTRSERPSIHKARRKVEFAEYTDNSLSTESASIPRKPSTLRTKTPTDESDAEPSQEDDHARPHEPRG